MDDEDLIPREDMVITVTHGGYVKRTALSTYRSQKHGGKGRSGMSTKDEDAVTRVFSASTHAPVLFFSVGRQGLQAEGLASAAGHSDLARQGVRQPAADRAGRKHHLDPAVAGGRGPVGTSWT
jgi:DNA gyrase/topoisomerase IV subunit A